MDEYEKWLPHTIEVYKQTTSVDEYGGPVTQWTELRGIHKARVLVLFTTPMTHEVGAVLQATSNWTVSVRADVEILHTDRIYFDGGVEGGRWLSIVFPPEPLSLAVFERSFVCSEARRT